MKETIKGINEIGDDFGLSEERKEDLQEIALDMLFRGYSSKEALKRSIERKVNRKTARQAENKAKWLRYWRREILLCTEYAISETQMAKLDAVIQELADWGGYEGFSTQFETSHLSRSEPTTADPKPKSRN